MAVPMRHEPPTFEQTMTELTAAVTEAFNRGDAKACAEFYTKDATALLPDRPPVKGREAIKAMLEEYVASGARIASIEPFEIVSRGELGYCAGVYRFEMPSQDGSTVAETGKFVTVLEQQPGGSWKAVLDSLIRDAPAG